MSGINRRREFGRGKNGVLLTAAVEAPGPLNDAPVSTLVLAEKRTKRPDILRNFRWYQGGWDISNKHYWASVGFTGAAGLILFVLWFVSFGMALVVHHCCGWRISIKGKESHCQRICLIMLIVFTCAAAFDEFVMDMKQNKRKNIRQDRKKIAAQNLTMKRLRGYEIKASHWDTFYKFYRNTTDNKFGEDD